MGGGGNGPRATEKVGSWAWYLIECGNEREKTFSGTAQATWLGHRM